MSVVFIEKTLVKSIAIEQQKKHVYMDCGTQKCWFAEQTDA